MAKGKKLIGELMRQVGQNSPVFVCENNNLSVLRKNGKIGVFAKKVFEVGETVELCPMLEMDGKSSQILNYVPVLALVRCSYPEGYDYPHKNKDVSGGKFICLGYGSLYRAKSADEQSNAVLKYVVDNGGKPKGVAAIRASSRIKVGEEIILDRGEGHDDIDTDMSDKRTILDDFFLQQQAITTILTRITNTGAVIDNLQTVIMPELAAILETAKKGDNPDYLGLDEVIVKIIEALKAIDAGIDPVKQ